jgi:pimeloyl-ACP methyl ester carboxylesterase
MLTLTPSGYRVFCLDLGAASAAPSKTLLLLHGFPESSFSYHKIVDGMSELFDRIVLLDLPGYGFSDKPGDEYSYSLIDQADAALQVWRALGVSGGHVLSHDMGTSVLTEIVARHAAGQLPVGFSDGLQSATFTNGSMVLRLAQLRLMQKLLLSRAGPTVSALGSYGAFRRTILSAHGVAVGAEHGLEEADISLLYESCRLQDGHRKNHHIITYLHDRRRFESSRWLPALGAVDGELPIHICWGDADQVARVEMAHYLAREVCPQATLSIMAGAGHFCQLGSPGLWLEHIGAFYPGPGG